MNHEHGNHCVWRHQWTERMTSSIDHWLTLTVIVNNTQQTTLTRNTVSEKSLSPVFAVPPHHWSAIAGNPSWSSQASTVPTLQFWAESCKESNLSAPRLPNNLPAAVDSLYRTEHVSNGNGDLSALTRDHTTWPNISSMILVLFSNN